MLDFGIAKAADRLQTTREGQLKGKLAYMAPEQIGGQVDRLTDIYAAGVVLWESLTGKRLYEAANEGQLLHMVLKGKRERPGHHVADLPGALDDITLRALQLEPNKRFATAREMSLALERSAELAMTSEVGDWVEHVAREQLSRRAERIAEIESSTKTRIPTGTKSAPLDDATERMAKPPHTGTTTPAASTAPASSRGRTAGTYEAPRRSSSRRRVLVIDQSEETLGRIRRALESAGFEVVTTTRAVGNARHIPTCDLAIIDYHMPGIDGGTIIQSFLSARGDHGCLFYLYTPDPEIARDYRKLGFDGVLTDKGDEAALVTQVRGVLRVLQMRATQKKRGP